MTDGNSHKTVHILPDPLLLRHVRFRCIREDNTAHTCLDADCKDMFIRDKHTGYAALPIGGRLLFHCDGYVDLLLDTFQIYTV